MSSPVARAVCCAAALLVAQPAVAQTAGAGVERVKALVENPNLPRDIDPDPVPPPALRPDGPAPLSEPPKSALTDFKLSQTYLPRFGHNGFGNHDTELSVQYALPGWE